MSQPSLFTPTTLLPGQDWPFGALEPMAYQMIMADPPWHFELYSQLGEVKSAQAQYETMTLDEIKALPVGALAAPGAALFLWGTSPLLLDADRPSRSPIGEVIEAWGFRYGALGGWAKRTVKGKLRFGNGYWMRSVMEPFFICSNGSAKHDRGSRNLIDGLARQHSRKPDEAYRWCERYMPNARRADLFSRETREGWESFGWESGKLDGVGMDKNLRRTASVPLLERAI